MTDSGTSGEHGSGIIPGWYADPYDANRLRWWDGTQWSDQVSALPTMPLPTETPAATEPTAATPATVEPLPSRRALRESGTSYQAPVTEPAVEQPAADPVSAVAPEPVAEPAEQTETEPPVAPADALDIFATPSQTIEETEIGEPAPIAAPTAAPSAWDTPATSPSAWDVPAKTDGPELPSNETASEPAPVDWGLSPRRHRPPETTTAGLPSSVWVWLIAFSPIIAALTVGYALATADAGSVGWMLPAALVVPYLLVLLFAVADRSGLTAQGHDDVVPWTWAALTAPVYLIVRGGFLRREAGRNPWPLIAWIIFFVLAIVGLFGYGLVSGHPLLAGLPG